MYGRNYGYVRHVDMLGCSGRLPQVTSYCRRALLRTFVPPCTTFGFMYGTQDFLVLIKYADLLRACMPVAQWVP